MESCSTETKCKYCGGTYFVEKPDLTDGTSHFSRIATNLYHDLINRAKCDQCIAKELKMEYQKARQLELKAKLNEIPFTQDFNSALAADGGALCKWIATNYQRRRNHLYIAGDYGIGKTRAICHVLGKVMERGKKCRYITCNDLLSSYGTMSSSDGKVRADRWLASLLHCEILAVDDLGKRNLSFAGCEALYNLLNYRYSGVGGGTAMIYLSANLSARDIVAKFQDEDTGQAFYSRLGRMGFLSHADDLHQTTAKMEIVQ